MVAVEPTLLRDSLARVLKMAGHDVTLAPPQNPHVEIAVISAGTSIDADVVIELPDETHREGRVVVHGQEQPTHFGDLTQLVQILDAYVAA